MKGSPTAAYDDSQRSGSRSLRWNILISFGLTFAVTLTLVSLVRTFGMPFTAYNGSYGQEQAQVFANLSLIADLKKERFELWLQERKADVEGLCQDDSLKSFIKRMRRAVDESAGPRSTSDQLSKVLSNDSSYENVLRQLDMVLQSSTGMRRLQIADGQTGIILASTDKTEVGTAIPDTQLFARTLNSPLGETVAMEKTSEGGEPYLLISRVITDGPSGTTAATTASAMVTAYIDTEAFLKPMLYTGEYLGRTGDIVLVDQEARILMSLKFPLADGTRAEVLRHHIASEAALIAARGEEGSALTEDYRGVPVLAAYRHIKVTSDTGWGMVVKRDRAEVFAPLWSRVLHSSIVSLLGLLVGAGVAILIASRVSRPIHNLLRAAQQLRSGNLSARAHVSGLVEAEELAATFNSMAERFQHWHQDLEEQVAARTEEIRIANTELTEEIISRKRTEAELAREKQRLAITLRSIGDGVISTDTDGKVVSLNTVAERLTGWTETQALGRPLEEIFSIINELTRERCENPISKVLATGLVFDLSNHTVLISRNGTERIIADSSAPIHDEEGSTVGVVLVFRDVTEHRLAHEALLRSERKYRTLFDDSRDGVYSVLRNGEILDANPSFLAIFGYTRQNMIGMDIGDLYVDPADRPRFQEEIERKGFVKDYQIRFRKKDGTAMDCLLTSSVQLGDDGDAVGYHGILRDVTEQKRAERKILEQNQFLHDLLESVTHPFYVVDTSNYRVIMANSAARVAFSSDEATCYALTHGRNEPCDRADHQCPLEAVKKTRGPVRVEHTHVDKHGKLRSVEINAYPVLDAEGNVRHMIEYALDATDRKQAEQERARLMTAIEQSAETILVTDSSGRIQYVNPAFERITGYTRQECIGETPRMLQSGKHDTAFYKAMWETLAAGQTWSGHFINKKKDGTLYEEEATISPIKDDSGSIMNYVAVTRDVTMEVSLQQQLLQAQKMEAIGTLAGGIAHDFNNLLTAMIGNASLVLDGMAVDDPHRHNVVQISFAAERAAALTRQLLAFGRKQMLEVKVLDLNAVIADFEKIVRRLVRESIDIVTAYDPLLGRVKADPGQVEQILMNLVVNARDAMPGGGTLAIQTANVTIDEDYARTHPESQPGDYVRFSVSDTGTGMDDDTLKHMFEPFFTTKEQGKGTGLGLSTVFGIVKQHQGHISVHSEPGQGSVFQVYLPRVETPVAQVRESREEGPKRQATETVLIVEDEAVVRDLACELLGMLGYSVLSAANPEEAVQVAEQYEGVIHLLLTDVVLPQMDGASLCKILSAGRPEMKVLYVSGYTEDFIVHHGVLHPGVHFLQKPFALDSLANKVREVLDAS